ncbi:hypothetical protein EXIGLDRAFT_753977 [Exidia glandulosa HHB12029]|uniref:DRBM domain-containing protein n=1 Tax=Exidia glandulosa HHB12029 TaxID=1314781 RepID=A0A165DC98_EXIGL|nr:hypothetical protein EXIGLDRAFT_753977 [Exidia glandulosa HHB12029]
MATLTTSGTDNVGCVQRLNNYYQDKRIDVTKIKYVVTSNANDSAHTATLTLENYNPVKTYTGNGASKRAAREEAAKKALTALGVSTTST